MLDECLVIFNGRKALRLFDGLMHLGHVGEELFLQVVQEGGGGVTSLGIL